MLPLGVDPRRRGLPLLEAACRPLRQQSQLVSPTHQKSTVRTGGPRQWRMCQFLSSLLRNLRWGEFPGFPAPLLKPVRYSRSSKIRISGCAVRVLIDEDATRDNVISELIKSRDAGFAIIHFFCGHAQLEDPHAGKCGLVLHDGALSTESIADYLTATRPALCFINACATGDDPAREFNVYDIGRAFVGAGAYLLGSCWALGEDVACRFAVSFYDSLLGRGESMGEAIRKARVRCRAVLPDDFGWASYVFYGDPRVCLRRCVSVTLLTLGWTLQLY